MSQNNTESSFLADFGRQAIAQVMQSHANPTVFQPQPQAMAPAQLGVAPQTVSLTNQQLQQLLERPSQPAPQQTDFMNWTRRQPAQKGASQINQCFTCQRGG